MKKITSIILSAVLILNIFCALSITVSAKTSGDYEYSISYNNATITGYYGSATELIIPSKLDGYTVTGIGDYAFKNITSLNSVTIPDSITSIGFNAFAGCTSLSTIDVNKNNEYYSSLNGSLYNKNQTELVQYAIGKNDTIFAIPDSVTNIGNDAFKFCTSLTSVTIPDSVTSIGYRAFYQCKSLESVTISDSVTSIGFKAFYDTAYYNNPDNWENDVLYIGKHLIEAKDTLSGEYNIKSGTLTVADSAFYGRNNYDTEKFETPVTGITIPDSVTSIGDGAFSANRSLSTINVSINNEYYSSLNGSLYNKNQTELVQYAIGKNDTIFAIPDSVKSIGNDAFSWCANLKYITIPNTVNYIGADAFYNCASLESISLPEGVTEIYDGTFSGCNNLNYVFYNGYQSNLSIGNFNGPLTSVIKYAKYKGTFSGGEWYFDYTTGVLRITGNGNMEFGNSQTIPWSEHKNDIKSVVIESGITSIADNAFTCCTSLSSVTIPNTISNIGESSFKGCEALMSLSIPDSVKSIGEEAFTDCKSLTSVTIGMGCKSISSKAFWDCPKLNKITVKYPNCIFDNSQYTISTTAVICGYKNSTAYTYARSYMRSFEDIETGIKYGWIDGSFIEIPTEIDPTNPTEPISSESWVVVKAPTCDESGVEVNYAAQKSRIVPALGHDYSDEFTIDKVATCTEDGLKSKHCSRCDSTTEKTIIPKTSHRPSSDWIIVKEATTTEEGLEEKHCLDCGAVIYFRTIPLLPQLVLGDVDGDGVVSIIDATCIQRHLAEIPVYAYIETAADTDGDGEVTILDATGIQRYLAELPCFTGIGNPIS